MTEVANNSSSLRERHGKTYRDLYSKCFLVTSAPLKFYWAGEFSEFIGAPLIGQNLPLRTSVGFEHTKTRGKIEISDTMYAPSKDRFISQMGQIHRKKLERFLQTLAEQLYRQADFPGLRIHTLGELSTGSGCGSAGTFAAALAVALLLDSGRITTADLNEWSKLPTYTLPQNHAFDRAHRIAWKISSLLYDGISSGGPCFISLVGSVYPIIYYSEKRAGLTAIPADVRLPMNIGENYNLLDRLFYGGIRLDELFHFQGNPSWPIEFFLVFSGVRKGSWTMKTVREIDDELMMISSTVQRTFDFLKTDPTIFSPVFYQQCLTEGWEGLHASYLGTSGILTLEVLFRLREVFELGGSEQAVANLCRSLNAFHDSLKILRRTTPFIDRLVYALESRLRVRLGAPTIGVKLTGSGHGGDLLVVTPTDAAQSGVEEEVAALRKETNKTVWLDYASQRDGWEERGVVVEQFLKESIYSPYVSQGSVILEVFSPEGKSSLTLTLEEFENQKAHFPLLCDLTTNDISIKGRQLTSKDLKSAKATVALLKCLLEHIGEKLTKDALPQSSYATDRNEIQSKILSPLQSTLRRTLKRTLPIVLQGPVRQYTISVSLPPFDTYVLTKRI